MNKKLEVFYDYTCPYCYKGLNELRQLMSEHPRIELDFMPCEAHPRPEFAKVHSDLAAALAYFLKDEGLDVDTYNKNIYNAHFEEKLRIDDIDMLCEIAEKLGTDKEKTKEILVSGKYADKVISANELAWGELSFQAVPSYRYNGKTAGSFGGKLISKEDILKLFK